MRQRRKVGHQQWDSEIDRLKLHSEPKYGWNVVNQYSTLHRYGLEWRSVCDTALGTERIVYLEKPWRIGHPYLAQLL